MVEEIDMYAEIGDGIEKIEALIVLGIYKPRTCPSLVDVFSPLSSASTSRISSSSTSKKRGVVRYDTTCHPAP